MMTSARARYAGYRFPSEIISHAVWLYFRFPLGLRMVEANYRPLRENEASTAPFVRTKWL
jgi:putative transposase